MTLQQYMEAHRMSAHHLARKVGCSRQTIYNWLRGRAVRREFWPKLEALGIGGFAKLYICTVQIEAGRYVFPDEHGQRVAVAVGDGAEVAS